MDTGDGISASRFSYLVHVSLAPCGWLLVRDRPIRPSSVQELRFDFLTSPSGVSVPSRASGRLVVVPRPQTDPTRPSPPALALYPVHVHSKNGAKSPRLGSSPLRTSLCLPPRHYVPGRRDPIPIPAEPLYSAAKRKVIGYRNRRPRRRQWQPPPPGSRGTAAQGTSCLRCARGWSHHCSSSDDGRAASIDRRISTH
jgi:hypothetical protein